MGKYRYEAGGIIRDLILDMPYHTDDIADLLTGKDIKITELQKQLKYLQGLNGEVIRLNRSIIKNSQILEKENEQFKKQLKEKDKIIQGLIEQKNIENNVSYQKILELQNQLEEKEKKVRKGGE